MAKQGKNEIRSRNGRHEASSMNTTFEHSLPHFQDPYETEQSFRTIFESAPIGILITDQEMRPIHTNPTFQKMLGYSSDEFRQFLFTDFTDSEDIEKSTSLFRGLLKNQHRNYRLEKRYIRKDGTAVWANVAVHLVSDSQGKPLYTIAMVEDITERKRILDEQARSEEKYRQVVENANEAILVAQDGMIKFFNSNALTMTGLDALELAQKPFLELIHPDDRMMVTLRHRERLKGNHPENNYAFRFITKDDDQKWAEINSVRIEWENRPATLNFIMDTTKRKRAETALLESEERFRTIFESAPIGILLTNKFMQPIQTNRSLQAMLGYTNEELTNCTFVDFTYHEDIEESVSMFKGLIEEKYNYYKIEKRYLHKEGQIIWAYLVVTSVRDSDGELMYTLAMVEDISDRKAVERALRKREAELEVQANYLEEANAALKMLLRKRDEDKTNLQNDVLANVQELLFPYIAQLKKIEKNQQQLSYLNIIEDNLKHIVSPFGFKISSMLKKLTPKEIQIAGMVKAGMTSKEISELMGITPRTVDFHRDSIRQKLEIKNKKINLRSHLLTLQ